VIDNRFYTENICADLFWSRNQEFSAVKALLPLLRTDGKLLSPLFGQAAILCFFLAHQSLKNIKKQ